MILGFMLESLLGPLKVCLIYIVAGIGGNMFSALCANGDAVGASTSLFGLIGCVIAMIIVNW